LLLVCATTAVAISAQTFKTVYSFDGANGSDPISVLVQATDGNLYGTTYYGGSAAFCTGNYGCGTIFKINPSSGKVTTLYSFCTQSGCTDGAGPAAGVIQATDGNFYGTTSGGGANTVGTVFKITAAGKLDTLYSFCPQGGACTDGITPLAGLVQATDGNFYGTAESGGAVFDGYSWGTIFKITPAGKLTTLHSFASTDGASPISGLVQATDGNLYGTTPSGANFQAGTVFRINPTSGKLTTLYSFCAEGSACADGASPRAGLIQAIDGNLYGTTYNSGANGQGGTIFKINSGSGKLTTIYSFCERGNCTDGANPRSGLVQANDENLYGTTYDGGGTHAGGTTFKITLGGTLTPLSAFCSQNGCTDGYSSVAGLVQDTNGNLYGTTAIGGNDACQLAVGEGCGTVFSLSGVLRPFVETQTDSGGVGAAVHILGTNLTDASKVSFNGTAAVFNVVSGAEITTTVPLDATTGAVEVTTDGGTLKSNVPFRVLPQAVTSASLESSHKPSTFGEPVTFTVAVTSEGGTPTGSVTFKNGSATLATETLSDGKASFETSALAVGSHSITAAYEGSSHFAASISSVLTQTVERAASSTKVASSLNPSTHGAAVTFTATVTSPGGTPTGTVTFKSGSSVLGTGTLTDGKATFKTSTLAVGTHSIMVVYAASTDFSGSTSPALSQVVNP
jgi:uncharacterized repeat protein (TIGR03803 family)